MFNALQVNPISGDSPLFLGTFPVVNTRRRGPAKQPVDGPENRYNAGPFSIADSRVTSVEMHPLPYRPDNTDTFARLLALPCPVLLDSGRPASGRGRYDIFCADPLEVVTHSLDQVNSATLPTAIADLQHTIGHLTPPLDDAGGLPFPGGAIGWLSYDAGLAWQKVAALPKPALAVPALTAGIYGWAVIADHHRQRTLLAVHPAAPRGTARRVLALLDRGTAPTLPELRCSGFAAEPERADYDAAFHRVQHYIRAGDCYQINLARRLSSPCSGHPWQRYQALRRTTAAPFSAYMGWPQQHILSLSPERFLRIRGRQIETQPIKGTAPRSADPATDARLASALVASDKNRAENLMIVDLLRNDLGKVCENGSIEVDKLFALQSFNTVHHLESRISGTLRPDVSPLAALANCFPGGSITGAPKRRAMQIIEELEPQRRGVYCGSIFYQGSSGDLDSNIAIRSLQFIGDRVLCHSGGGIVADSSCDAEFTESEDKISNIISCLLHQ